MWVCVGVWEGLLVVTAGKSPSLFINLLGNKVLCVVVVVVTTGGSVSKFQILYDAGEHPTYL